MADSKRHIAGNLSSSIVVKASLQTIWQHITNVEIEKFSNPLLFRLLDVPKPLRAEIVAEGKHGKRIAYFKSGKRFIQEILEWKPFTNYAFSFNPEKGFKVLHWFDISDGAFRILAGSYRLTPDNGDVVLQLTSTYSIDRRVNWLFKHPARIILKIFQRYLLTSIKKNSEE